MARCKICQIDGDSMSGIVMHAPDCPNGVGAPGYDSEDYYLSPDEEEDAAREEYYYSHGTCEICGGEWGEGWSSCLCDDAEAEEG
jgi:hypothetical protein